MEILKNFGVDYRLLIAQIINFLIVFYILRRFFLKPIIDVLKKRKQTIEEGLKNAERSKRALEEALVKEKEILKRAQKEAQALLQDTKKQSGDIIKRAKEHAQDQADRILKEAKEDIAQEIKNTEKNLSIYVSRLAVQLLERSTRDLFGEREQEEILSKAVKKLKEKKN